MLIVGFARISLTGMCNAMIRPGKIGMGNKPVEYSNLQRLTLSEVWYVSRESGTILGQQV